MRRGLILLSCLALQGCWFVYIPGSAVDSIADSLSGAEGEHCIPEWVKVGDAVNFPSVGLGTVKSLSGTSRRCPDPKLPIRALVDFGALRGTPQ